MAPADLAEPPRLGRLLADFLNRPLVARRRAVAGGAVSWLGSCQFTSSSERVARNCSAAMTPVMMNSTTDTAEAKPICAPPAPKASRMV